MNRSDDFTRANSNTTLGTPSDGGGGYTLLNGGTWGIRSNHGYLVATGGGNDKAAVLDAESSNVSISCKPYDVLCGPCFRSRFVTYFNSSTVIKVSKGAGGSFSDIVTLTSQPALSAGTTVLAIREKPTDSSKTEVLRDGSVIHEFTDSENSTNEFHGPWSYGTGASIEVDDLVITDQSATVLDAGTLTNTSNTPTSAGFSLATNTGGTSPYSSQLQRSPAGAGTWSNIGSAQSGATPTFTDSTVSQGTAYDYRVEVTDDVAATDTSNTVSITTPTAATQFAITGPSAGSVDVASSNFTVTPNGYVASATVTPGDGAATGTFDPATLTWTGESGAKTFTYTPDAPGTITIAPSTTAGSPSTHSPTSLDYVAAITSLLYCEGDSLTAGVTGRSYPSLVEDALSADWTVTNGGTGGDRIAEIEDDAATVDALYDADRPFNILAVMIGTNDFGTSTGPLTAAQATAALKSYCQDRQAAGWLVIVIAPPSANYSGNDIDAELNDYADLIDADWESFADVFINLMADAIFDTGSYADTTYYNADELHLVTPGNAVVAMYVLGAIAALTYEPASGGGTGVSGARIFTGF